MTIAQILSEEVIQALGWTVVHSLWQAALLAAVAGVGMLLMHQRPARERYLLSLNALAGVLVWAAITFFNYYEPTAELPVAAIVPGDMTALPLTTPTGNWSGGMTEQFSAYFSRNAPLIATLWMLGMTFFLLRMLGALMYANQLKRRHVSPLPEKWQQTLLHFARRIGIRRAVRLLESAAIKTPMTIGYLKPVILLPIGMVNNLSPQQVEAVLAHELAHIYRSDFLVNIFQAMIETLFYFNPAVWWLSAAVRAEREDCCDDIAILHCNNSLDYAKALVSVQEWARPRSNFALAFSGSKNRLLNRVRRILNHPQNKSNIMEKFTATCLLLLAVLVLTVSAAYPDQDSPDTSPVLSAVAAGTPVVTTDSLPKGNARVNLEKNGKSLEAKVKDGVITYLKVNGKEIPPADYAQYENMVEEAFGEAPLPPMPPMPPMPPTAPMAPMAPMSPVPPAPPADFWGDGATHHIIKERDANGNTLFKIEGSDSAAPFVFEWNDENKTFKLNGELFEEGHLFPNPRIEEGHYLNLLKEKELAIALAEGFREDALFKAEEHKALNEAQRKALMAHKKEWKALEKQRKEKWGEHRNQQDQAARELGRVENFPGRVENFLPQPDGNIWGYFEDGGRVDRTVESALEKALVKDGLIQNTENYTLELTGKGMKVNGKKQPDEVWERYKAIYRKVSGFELNGKSKIVVDKDEAQ